ncbi:MAG: hypothetical protein FJ290_12745 [Planctomycetes bacterium]|nr:hypothetical protein [Planctomycetota bacterium]
MLFNSHEFLFLLLPLAVAGALLLARAGRRDAAFAWLGLASFVFYGWPDIRVWLGSVPAAPGQGRVPLLALQGRRAPLRTLAREGLPRRPHRIAAAIALLLVLLNLTRASEFIYWQF